MNKEADSLVLQQVNEDTFNDFLELIKKLADYEKLAPPNEEAKIRLRIDCLSDKPRYHAFMGKIGNRYVAYMIYFFTYSSFKALPILYLEDIFVVQEYRKQGIGKKMFDYLKEKAKLEGCFRIDFAVLNWNAPAQEFYKKNKAKPTEWIVYELIKENF